MTKGPEAKAPGPFVCPPGTLPRGSRYKRTDGSRERDGARPVSRVRNRVAGSGRAGCNQCGSYMFEEEAAVVEWTAIAGIGLIALGMVLTPGPNMIYLAGLALHRALGKSRPATALP
jgi:hypothetical protein